MVKSVRSKQAALDAIEGYLRYNQNGDELVPRRVVSALDGHATAVAQFKPEAIWRMAMYDLERRAGNATAGIAKMRVYHFHRDHVRKAKSANDVLRAAIADPEAGRESSKKLTRLLYADVEQLKAALR
jgi:hypothetical protein